ncbi:hypothetical protein V6N13_067696 [Hibiscus sabdariffa]
MEHLLNDGGLSSIVDVSSDVPVKFSSVARRHVSSEEAVREGVQEPIFSSGAVQESLSQPEAAAQEAAQFQPEAAAQEAAQSQPEAAAQSQSEAADQQTQPEADAQGVTQADARRVTQFEAVQESVRQPVSQFEAVQEQSPELVHEPVFPDKVVQRSALGHVPIVYRRRVKGGSGVMCLGNFGDQSAMCQQPSVVQQPDIIQQPSVVQQPCVVQQSPSNPPGQPSCSTTSGHVASSAQEQASCSVSSSASSSGSSLQNCHPMDSPKHSFK